MFAIVGLVDQDGWFTRGHIISHGIVPHTSSKATFTVISPGRHQDPPATFAGIYLGGKLNAWNTITPGSTFLHRKTSRKIHTRANQDQLGESPPARDWRRVVRRATYRCLVVGRVVALFQLSDWSLLTERIVVFWNRHLIEAWFVLMFSCLNWTKIIQGNEKGKLLELSWIYSSIVTAHDDVGCDEIKLIPYTSNMSRIDYFFSTVSKYILNEPVKQNISISRWNINSVPSRPHFPGQCSCVNFSYA